MVAAVTHRRRPVSRTGRPPVRRSALRATAAVKIRHQPLGAGDRVGQAPQPSRVRAGAGGQRSGTIRQPNGSWADPRSSSGSDREPELARQLKCASRTFSARLSAVPVCPAVQAVCQDRLYAGTRLRPLVSTLGPPSFEQQHPSSASTTCGARLLAMIRTRLSAIGRDRKLAGHGRAAALRAVQGEDAAQRFDTVPQPGQS